MGPPFVVKPGAFIRVAFWPPKIAVLKQRVYLPRCRALYLGSLRPPSLCGPPTFKSQRGNKPLRAKPPLSEDFTLSVGAQRGAQPVNPGIQGCPRLR